MCVIWINLDYVFFLKNLSGRRVAERERVVCSGSEGGRVCKQGKVEKEKHRRDAEKGKPIREKERAHVAQRQVAAAGVAQKKKNEGARI